MSQQFRAVERSLDPEGPGKRPAADRLIETERGGVYISAPAGQRTAWIREASTLDHHDAQQIALGRSLPASHAGSLRAGAGVRPARHAQVYLPAPPSPLGGNGRTLAGQKDSVDLRTVRRPMSRAWAELIVGDRRVVADGRIRCGRRIDGSGGPVRPACAVGAPCRSGCRRPVSYVAGAAPYVVGLAPCVPARRGQPRSSRGDRPPAAAPLSRAPSAPSAPSVCSVSGRMSMRQPVRRAARRAFCPSLPIASDSW